jgi:hypothetical protein
MAVRFKIGWIDNLIVPIFLVTVLILRLTTVARVVEEERVVRTGIADEPLHGIHDIPLRRDLAGVGRVIREGDNVLLPIVPLGAKEALDVRHIVDTSTQLSRGSFVVDANKQCLAASVTHRVLEVRLLLLSTGALELRAIILHPTGRHMCRRRRYRFSYHQFPIFKAKSLYSLLTRRSVRPRRVRVALRGIAPPTLLRWGWSGRSSIRATLRRRA